MRRMLIFLLVAGCNSQNAPEADPAAEPDSLQPPAAAGAAAPAQQAARNEQRAAQALSAILVDPKSARYSELRSGTAGAVCGRVDSRQGDGKYAGARPFVVTPEGVAVISTTPQVAFEDPEDMFPDFYIRWCATPEEMRRVAPRITAQPLPELPPIEDYEVPEAELSPPPTGSPPQQSAKAPAPAKPDPSAEEESFSKVVIRNEVEGSAR